MPLDARVIRKVQTPALVVDERQVLRDVAAAAMLRDRCGCKLLYALKPMTCEFVLELMIDKVDGFAVSSLFESRLAREVLAVARYSPLDDARTPRLRAGRTCRAMRLRVVQLAVAAARAWPALSTSPNQVGLRINPELSLVPDARYDPCRPHSKLGVPLEMLEKRWERQARPLRASVGLALSQQLRLHDSRAAPSHGQARRLDPRRQAFQPDLDQPGGRLPLERARRTSICSRKRSGGSSLATGFVFTSSRGPRWFARRAISSHR